MPLGISGGAVVDPVAAPQEKAQCPGVGLPDSDLGEVVLGHGMLKQAASMLFRFLILCAVLFFSHVSGTSCNRFFKSK